MAAINDWPNQIANLVDYESAVYKLVGKEADKRKTEDFFSKIDYSKNTWEAESLNQLMEVYKHYDEDKQSREIFKEVKERIG